MNDFRRHMHASANVKLYVGELAYGDRPFEVTSTSADNSTHRHRHHDLQLRTRHELWHKENLLNLIIQRFDQDWQYGAYVDGDFLFTRHDWALEAVHLLQHYDWVQLFSSYSDLDEKHVPVRTMKSFANRYLSGELTDDLREKIYKEGTYNHPGVHVGATGGAWAFRRDAFEKCGGLLDTCILGSGDWHCAFGLACEPDVHPQVHELTGCGRAYAESIKIWQSRASRAIRKNIGCVDCFAVHAYHGKKSDRGYDWRWQILRDNDFNPNTDLFRDAQGVYQITPEKITLRDDIRNYFRIRSEDS